MYDAARPPLDARDRVHAPQIECMRLERSRSPACASRAQDGTHAPRALDMECMRLTRSRLPARSPAVCAAPRRLGLCRRPRSRRIRLRRCLGGGWREGEGSGWVNGAPWLRVALAVAFEGRVEVRGGGRAYRWAAEGHAGGGHTSDRRQDSAGLGDRAEGERALEERARRDRT